MPLTEPQKLIASSTTRMRCVVSGRRFGKSTLALREAARFAVPPKQTIFICAPTYRQVKGVFWNPLKERLSEINWVAKINESDLTITIRNGSTISLRSTDNFNSLRGVGLNFLVMDEFSDSHPDAWERVLRPTLSDKRGHALFLGTPRGRNHLYEHYMKGQDPDKPDWESWQFTTLQGGNVPPEEVEAARHDLSPELFDAEYNASFVEYAGRIYTGFKAATHCAPLKYTRSAPLILCFDFNTAPGVCAVIQEQRLPNGMDGTGVIGEVWIKAHSTTPAVCRKIVQDWGEHPGQVICYGDATSGAGGSAKVLGDDWALIRNELRPVFGNRLSFRVLDANPRERIRVNALNSRLLSAAGDIRLMVDPIKAPHVVTDFEGVQALEGGAGEIDKKINPELRNLSDSIGYYCVKEWPIARQGATLNKFVLGG